jgi:hypothetical protein
MPVLQIIWSVFGRSSTINCWPFSFSYITTVFFLEECIRNCRKMTISHVSAYQMKLTLSKVPEMYAKYPRPSSADQSRLRILPFCSFLRYAPWSAETFEFIKLTFNSLCYSAKAIWNLINICFTTIHSQVWISILLSLSIYSYAPAYFCWKCRDICVQTKHS